jgi:hypothetical protein
MDMEQATSPSSALLPQWCDYLGSVIVVVVAFSVAVASANQWTTLTWLLLQSQIRVTIKNEHKLL